MDTDLAVTREGVGKRLSGAGQSVVEFALVLPILLALTMGVVDLGLGLYAGNSVAAASRQGARYLSLQPSATDQQLYETTAAGMAGLSTDPAVLSVAASPGDPDQRLPGTMVTVTVSYSFYPVLPIGKVVGMLVGPSGGAPSGDYFPIRSSSASYVESGQ